MLLVLLLFACGIVLPFAFRIMLLPDDTSARIVIGLLVTVLVIIAGAAAVRLGGSRPRRRGVAAPNPKRVASLKWPRQLSGLAFEAYCTAFLREQGWTVAPVLSDAADGTFLDARRGDARALMLCDAAGESLTPARVRGLAAAAGLASARAALLTQSREPIAPPVEAAARSAGVALLRVADLPRLSSLVVADPVAAPAMAH